jgi:hypothetical protein
MQKILTRIFEALAQGARQRAIRELDERTLRDVGLEVEANLARERTRLAKRFGAY